MGDTNKDLELAVHLDRFIPDKAAVDTSFGRLYVAHTSGCILTKTDKLQLGEPDLAKAIVQLYVNEFQDKMNSSELSDSVFSKLVEDDVKALLLVIAEKNFTEKAPFPVDIHELSVLIKKSIVGEAEKLARQMDEAISNSYNFMDDASIKSIQRLASDINARAIALDQASQSELLSPQNLGSIARHSQIEQAAENRAKKADEIHQGVLSLTQNVAELTTKIVCKVLPTWFKQVSKQQEDSLAAAEKAQNSLKWTRVAVYVSVAATIVSVLVTAGVAYWQTQVSRELDRSSTAMQTEIQVLLQKQLAGQERLIEIQANEIERLKKKEIEGAPLEKEDLIVERP